MDDLLSEKEQIDQMRTWWKEYGAFVIGGIVIGAGLLFGINHYQSSKLQTQLDASAAYEELVVFVMDGKLEDAEAAADKIATSYGDTSYAGQSGLAMARLYMDKNRDQDAADALLVVVDSAADSELKDIARLRLARIYLYQDKAQEVVDLLAGEDVGAFAAPYGEALGDAYTALGRIAEAQDAYQKILMNSSQRGTVDQQLVEWKSLDLPEVMPEMADPAPAAEVEEDESVAEENE